MILKRTHDVNHCSGKLGTMHRAKKIPITDLNQHLICVLCKGYFIDATTIIECLHSFCRSCIVQYLEKNKYCPVCDVQVHKTKPLLNIRPDKTLQSIVYKLVPGLFQNEIRRRKDFYSVHPDAKPTWWEQRDEASFQHLLSPEETICLSLNYHDSGGTPRYLRCPAAVSVAHLQKLIRAKYDLSEQHRVDVLFNQDCLNSYLTLMDIACIYLWRRKGPLELTYRIYENTAKRLKLEVEETDKEPIEQTVVNNNDWKEVQLQISENGEMSITGIQDSIEDIMSEHGIVQKTDKEELEIKPVESKSLKKVGKREMPALKVIGKGVCNKTTAAAMKVEKPEISLKLEEIKEAKVVNPSVSTIVSSTTTTVSTVSSKTSTVKSLKSDNNNKVALSKTSNGSLVKDSDNQSGSSITSSITQVKEDVTLGNEASSTEGKVLTSNGDQPAEKDKGVPENNTTMPVVPNSITKSTPSTNCSNSDSTNCNKGQVKQDSNESAGPKEPEPREGKHKLQNSTTTKEDGEPPAKQPKPTILNHSLGLPNLGIHSPKKHMQRFLEESPISEQKSRLNSNQILTNNVPTTIYNKPPTIINKNFNNTQQKWPSTKPLQPAHSYIAGKPMAYTPVINVPKVQPSTSTQKVESNPQNIQQTNAQPNKMATIKTKPSTPIGYKTLRDPPKTWNPQISRANLTKPPADPKYSDLKNVRPAKFFKMRNNMPRYLGNPASGVKPLYQVHVSPEKEKQEAATPPQKEKTEIKKHSIVKIDPKTLKPISERAPDTSNLSNQSDLKINTSSVSIFNPLKLQSSPKSDRKSPKSPHSPKTKSSSPPMKREKLNLNFTPPNPFIPNLGAPTVSPTQFLYSSGPTGYPPYDPLVMAAYHKFLYGQRLPFPAPMSNLSLDLNQRKGLELGPPTSPKLPNVPQQHSPKATTCVISPLSHPASSKHPVSLNSTITNTSITITQTSTTPINRPSRMSFQPPHKKHKDSPKQEKSLMNTLEKLTQNRVKENAKIESQGVKEPPKVEKPTETPQEPQESSKKIDNVEKCDSVKATEVKAAPDLKENNQKSEEILEKPKELPDEKPKDLEPEKKDAEQKPEEAPGRKAVSDETDNKVSAVEKTDGVDTNIETSK